MNLVFTWIQWCGKWTQARLLIEKHWFEIVEMWWELRKIANEDSDFWREIRATIDSWNLVTPDKIAEIIKRVVTANKWKNMIYDWFIRNQWNKKAFESVCKDYKVIFFDLDEEIAKSRLLWRMFNEKTWETFPAWTQTDPKTWDKLIKRDDDNEQSILTRIDSYMNITLPVVHEQMNEDKVIEIDADQSIEDVFKDIEDSLWLK